MLKEKKLLLAPVCCLQVSALCRCCRFPTGSEPPRSRAGTRGPRTGTRSCDRNSWDANGSAGRCKAGTVCGSHSGCEGPGSAFPPWQGMLLALAPTGIIPVLQEASRDKEIPAVSPFCLHFQPSGQDPVVTWEPRFRWKRWAIQNLVVMGTALTTPTPNSKPPEPPTAV